MRLSKGEKGEREVARGRVEKWAEAAFSPRPIFTDERGEGVGNE